MRAIHCGCDRYLQAADYEGLVEAVLAHLGQEHPEIKLGKSQVRVVREIVAAGSYRSAEYGNP